MGRHGRGMYAVGVVGERDVGKTSVVEAVLAEAGPTARWATVKSIHHDVRIDEPGKDTDRHRRAGADAVVGVTPPTTFEVAARHDPADAAKVAPLRAALERLGTRGVEGVLVEGFSASALPKILVGDRADVDGVVVERLPERPSVDAAGLLERARGLSTYPPVGTTPDADAVDGVLGRGVVSLPVANPPSVWTDPEPLDGLGPVAGRLEALREDLGDREGVRSVRLDRRPPVGADEPRSPVVCRLVAATRAACFGALAAWEDGVRAAAGDAEVRVGPAAVGAGAGLTGRGDRRGAR